MNSDVPILFFTTSSEDIEVDIVLNKLRSFGSLAKGWNFGRGETFTEELIKKAKDIITYVYASVNVIFNCDVFANDDGSILLSFSKRDDFIDIKIDRDLELHLTHEKGIGANYEIINECSNTTLEYIIEELYKVCNSLELLTSITIIKESKDSTVISLTPTEEASQSLMEIVQEKRAVTYASTSEGIICQL